MLDLSPDAKAYWIKFYNSIEKQQGKDGELFDVRDVASKVAENAARLAALFHLLEVGGSGEINQAHMESAARIAEWHLYESQRFFNGLTISDQQRQIAKLDKWLIDRCRQSGGQSIPTREVMQYGPGKLRKKAMLEAAIDDLVALGRVRQVKQGHKKLIEVNPALLSEEN